MTQKKKNNIIIGSLCAVVLLMVVGYAAFSSILNIKGTSNISSNWDIKITKITSKVLKGNATNASDPTGVNTLTASFETNLVSPGDSMEYVITVTNSGSLNATLEKITMSQPDNEYVTFAASINGETITAGENMTFTETTQTLNAGESKDITVVVTFKDVTISKMEPTTSKLTLTLDYAQADGSGGTDTPIIPEPEPIPTDGIVYRLGTENVGIGDSVDSLDGVTTNYKTLGENYFLKHTLSNGLVTSSEACFIKNDLLYCLIPNEYTNNQNLMANAFEDSECKIYRGETECHDINISVFAYTTGHVYVYPAGSSSQCVVRDDLSSYCYIS